MAEVAHGGIAALPDELLLEVFSRVGSVKDLFRFAVTSRRWLRLFTDRAFLRLLCPAEGKGHRARLLGFVFQPMQVTQHTSVSMPTFLPTPGSPFGAKERALTSLVAADDDGAFNYAEPLGARRGIVLMQLFSDFDLRYKKATTVDAHDLFGLCNPATGERHVLPPLDHDVRVNGYAIVTADDDLDDGKHHPPRPSSSPGRSAFSQLILFGRYAWGTQCHLHWYSAATRSWRVVPTTCLDGLPDVFLVGERSAVVHGGAAHWLCNGQEGSSTSAAYKLSVELGTGRVVSLAKLPIRTGGTPLLWVGRDDKLSIACVYPSYVTIWTRRDEEDAWFRKHLFRLPMEANPNDPPLLKWKNYFERWFWFDRGTMLVLYRLGGVFVLDVEEEAMEKVMDWFPSLYCEKNKHLRYVPYELDLVDFFVSRLGGLLCRG